MKIINSATRITLLIVVLTLSYLSIQQTPIPSELKDVIIMVVSYYFGAKSKPETELG